MEYPRIYSNNYVDCSEYCYLVMKKYSPVIADGFVKNGNVNTASIQEYIEAHGGFRKENPQIGDLVMWNGHVAIVSAVYGKYWIMHGASGKNDTPVPRYTGRKNGVLWLEPNYRPQGQWPWGNGRFLGFWTPR